jgi:SAM-dependent methyltransferase
MAQEDHSTAALDHSGLHQRREEQIKKLNLGCGSTAADGWVNVDYALGARLAKLPLFRGVNKRLGLIKLDWDDKILVHDLTKPFPWPDSSIDAIYSSHTLEHFDKEDGRAFLEECHRVLRQSGILRIVVPDLRALVLDYTEGRLCADDFIVKLGVLPGGNSGSLKTRLAPLVQFPHKCMYDASRLVEILDEIGFELSRRGAFDSEIQDIGSVELEDRTRNAVIVEGRKR